MAPASSQLTWLQKGCPEKRSAPETEIIQKDALPSSVALKADRIRNVKRSTPTQETCSITDGWHSTTRWTLFIHATRLVGDVFSWCCSLHRFGHRGVEAQVFSWMWLWFWGAVWVPVKQEEGESGKTARRQQLEREDRERAVFQSC